MIHKLWLKIELWRALVQLNQEPCGIHRMTWRYYVIFEKKRLFMTPDDHPNNLTSSTPSILFHIMMGISHNDANDNFRSVNLTISGWWTSNNRMSSDSDVFFIKYKLFVYINDLFLAQSWICWRQIEIVLILISLFFISSYFRGYFWVGSKA